MMGGVGNVWRRDGSVNDGWVVLLCGVEQRVSIVGGCCVALIFMGVRL